MLIRMANYLPCLPALGWAGLIFYFSSRRVDSHPAWWFFNADKLIHAGIFGILALLVYFALRRTFGLDGRRAAARAFLATVLYGVFDECHQLFTPTRSGDIADVAADAVGAICAWLPPRVGRRHDDSG